MRISQLILFFASVMLLANLPTRILYAQDCRVGVERSHLTSRIEIIEGTVSSDPDFNDLSHLNENNGTSYNVFDSKNRNINVEFETFVPVDSVVFSFNLVALSRPLSGAFAGDTAERRIKNWATDEFDEITSLRNIPANLYVEPGTGKVLVQLSESFSQATEYFFFQATWTSSNALPLGSLGQETADSLVLSPNGDDIYDIYDDDDPNVRIQTILPGVDLTSISRGGRGILIAPDVVWNASHIGSATLDRAYTFVDNLGNEHRALTSSFSGRLGGDGRLIRIEWVDETGAIIPPPTEIKPALLPPADFPCLSRNFTNNVGYRVDHVYINEAGGTNRGRNRLTAGRFVFGPAVVGDTPVFRLFEQPSSILPAAAWDDATCGDSGGAMFVVVRGQVVAMGATWTLFEECTAITSYLAEIEEFSTGHEYVDLTDFRGFLLGDVNRNEVVNFSDFSLFISISSAGGFQVEADINQDGVVNFLDISPFIAILSAQ